MKPSSEICEPLSNEVTKQVCTSGIRDSFIVDFLKKRLLDSDVRGISDELTKTFIFDKVKSRVQKPKPKKHSFLTFRKRKLIGMNNIQIQSNLKYHELVPLNKLWLEYILQVIGFTSFSKLPTSSVDQRWEMINQRLMKADYHGAKIRVIRSKCPSLIGIDGIIIQDTKNALQIISDDNVVRTIPKQVVVIRIYLTGASLEVFGKELSIRPAERSVKKFKANHMSEL